MNSSDTLSTGFIHLTHCVYGASPTRRHEVIVIREADVWVAWAGRWDKRSGSTPSKEWMLYQGTSLEAALQAATRFAGRFRR